MSYSNLGPNVSQNPQTIIPGGGSFTAEDHSFESIVFQSNSPMADWELNLLQEISGAYGTRQLTSKLYPSTFLTGGYLDNPSILDSYSFLTPDPPTAATANKFRISGQDLLVNGWTVRFDLTDSATLGINNIALPVPPASGNRTDLVFLEFWRALISPAPDTTNKSATGQVLRYGNAKAADSGPPGNENLGDDLLDPVYTTETSRRVQIQYRYRVVTGIDLRTYPDGLDNVIARTVPYKNLSTVDGDTTALAYAQMPDDNGLWYAGNGDSTDAGILGTVDGRIYAIPLCAVFRRNSTAFNRVTNLNGGGLMASSTSGRPDGLYADQIVAADIRDLRKSFGTNFTEILEKNEQFVLSNQMSNEWELSSDGVAGTSYFAKENVGTSGRMGNPDGVRLDFSDRSTLQSVVVKNVIVAPTTTTTFALNSLPIHWSGSPINVKSLAAANTSIHSIGKVRIVSAVSDKDGLNAVTPYVSSIDFTAAPGPEIDFLTLTFDSSVNNVTVFVELFIEYPSELGTARSMVQAHQVWTPPAANIAAWVDAATLTATSDVDRRSLDSSLWWVSPSHREFSVRLKSSSIIASHFAATTTTLFIPDRVTGTVTLDGGRTVTNVTSNTAYTTVTFTPAGLVGDVISVTYTALRALPPVGASPGDSYQFFYQARAVQSIPVPSGTQTLNLIPRAFGKFLNVISSGSGSADDTFPYTEPSAQIPVGTQPAGDYPDSRLSNPGQLNITSFSTAGGFIQLPVMIPYTPDPSSVTLYKSGGDSVSDADGRNFWSKSDSGSATYSPSVYAQNLTFMGRHKVEYPVLMELKSNFNTIGRKGTLVLVIFSKWFEFDKTNSISLSSIVGDSAASVFRVRGNLLNSRRVQS